MLTRPYGDGKQVFHSKGYSNNYTQLGTLLKKKS